MAYWDLTNPLKPVGIIDPDAVLDIPFRWTEWLATMNVTIASHLCTCSPELEVVSETDAGGIVVPLVRRKPGQTLIAGQKYFLKCHIVTTGPPVREDERTVFLKITER